MSSALLLLALQHDIINTRLLSRPLQEFVFRQEPEKERKTGNEWRLQRTQSRYMSTTEMETSDPLASDANGSCCHINNGLLP